MSVTFLHRTASLIECKILQYPFWLSAACVRYVNHDIFGLELLRNLQSFTAYSFLRAVPHEWTIPSVKYSGADLGHNFYSYRCDNRSRTGKNGRQKAFHSVPKTKQAGIQYKARMLLSGVDLFLNRFYGISSSRNMCSTASPMSSQIMCGSVRLKNSALTEVSPFKVSRNSSGS